MTEGIIDITNRLPKQAPTLYVYENDPTVIYTRDPIIPRMGQDD